MNTTEQINYLPDTIQKEIYADVNRAKQLYTRIKSAITDTNLNNLSTLLGEVLENSIVLTYLQTKIATFIETQQQIILSHQTKHEFAELWYKILTTKQ
jgi:hypothetical protein